MNPEPPCLDCLAVSATREARGRCLFGDYGVGGEGASVWPCVCARCHGPYAGRKGKHAQKRTAVPSNHPGSCLAEWFSEEKIRESLCKRRVRLARQRGKADPQHGLKRVQKPPLGEEAELMAAFPSKKELHRVRTKYRHGISSEKVLEKALHVLIDRQLALPKGQQADWFGRLGILVDRVRRRALDGEFQFCSFEVIPTLKAGNAFRPITKSDLIETVIASTVASYLRVRLDPQWSDSSFAFREPKKEVLAGHHGAFEALVDFRGRFENQFLWAAEMDIQSFFDSVSHDIIRAACKKAGIRATREGKPVCSRAWGIVEALLAGYDFRRVVRGQAEPKLRKEHPSAYFAWPEESLKRLVPHFDTAKIGIPQGNALSPILANIVLDYADRGVCKAVGPTNNLFYCRYCDDIMIISPSLRLAQTAWRAYGSALRKLLLPAHAHNPPSGKRAKSRQPYRWAKGADEWVDYVGYRIWYDGQTQIREASEQKHRGKIMAVVDQFLRAIEKEANTKGKRPWNASYDMRRLVRHLVATATGRQPLWKTQSRPMGLCWIAGFKHQRCNPGLLKQLRNLDRFRHSQIHFAAKRLQKILSLPDTPGKGRLSRKYRFIGYPISYCGQFHKY